MACGRGQQQGQAPGLSAALPPAQAGPAGCAAAVEPSIRSRTASAARTRTIGGHRRHQLAAARQLKAADGGGRHGLAGAAVHADAAVGVLRRTSTRRVDGQPCRRMLLLRGPAPVPLLIIRPKCVHGKSTQHATGIPSITHHGHRPAAGAQHLPPLDKPAVPLPLHGGVQHDAILIDGRLAAEEGGPRHVCTSGSTRGST